MPVLQAIFHMRNIVPHSCPFFLAMSLSSSVSLLEFKSEHLVSFFLIIGAELLVVNYG